MGAPVPMPGRIHGIHAGRVACQLEQLLLKAGTHEQAEHRHAAVAYVAAPLQGLDVCPGVPVRVVDHDRSNARQLCAKTTAVGGLHEHKRTPAHTQPHALSACSTCVQFWVQGASDVIDH